MEFFTYEKSVVEVKRLVVTRHSARRGDSMIRASNSSLTRVFT